MTYTWVDIFAVSCLLGVLAYLFYIIYYAIGLYDLNPFRRPKPLSQNEKNTLLRFFPYLGNKDDEIQNNFFKRVAWFKAKKPFVFKHTDSSNKNVILLVSGAGSYLFLGFRRYKMIRSLHKVVLHPQKYYSNFHRRYHLGEYHPGLKVLALAEDVVNLGFNDAKDNKNLAIHEFAHVLYFETKGKNTWEALRFQWGFRKLKRIFEDEQGMNNLMDSDYFRPYGKTNVYEFLSVLTENYVETPEVLNEKFPELFQTLSRMYNFNPLHD